MIAALLVASSLAAPQFSQFELPSHDEYGLPHEDNGVPHADYGVPHEEYGVPSTTEQ